MVYASVTTAQVNLEKIDELAPLYERFLPTLSSAQGWLGVYLLVDRSTGDGQVVGLWENAADAQSFETSGTFRELLAQYPTGVLVGPPQRRVAEVIFHASRARLPG